jgi:hypothetical protein
MENIIKLNSHDGTNNYLKKLNVPAFQGKQAYVLVSPYNHMRGGKVDEDRQFIDPSGGPMLVEKDEIGDYIIFKIIHVMYIGYILLLEKKNDLFGYQAEGII